MPAAKPGMLKPSRVRRAVVGFRRLISLCSGTICVLMRFATRQDAGRELGRLLAEQRVKADVAVGLPRGGVVIAAEIADELQIPLDVLIVRKIGHPLHREFAVGALAESDIVVLDPNVTGWDTLSRRQLDDVIREETDRLREYEQKFRPDRSCGYQSKTILLIDDGLATGATMEAAVLSARKQGAARVIVAVPVASTNALERIGRVADDVIALWADPDFNAVGAYYDSFSQTTDEEVLSLIHGVHH